MIGALFFAVIAPAAWRPLLPSPAGTGRVRIAVENNNGVESGRREIAGSRLLANAVVEDLDVLGDFPLSPLSCGKATVMHPGYPGLLFDTDRRFAGASTDSPSNATSFIASTRNSGV